MIINNFVLLILVSFSTKAKADKCDVGVNGCSWTCKPASMQPRKAKCLAFPSTPQSCEIGSTATICGTTCSCSKAETCTVGVKGCSWTCKRDVLKRGPETCLAIPGTPKTCVVGSSVTTCGTTCTCSQAKTCTVAVNGCKWSCVTSPPKPGVGQCKALPSTPFECYPGETSSMCGTTCTCEIGRGTS